MASCRLCGQAYSFTEKEVQLREKISSLLGTGPLPEPTCCKDCRMRLHMMRRNERTLYRRKCDATGKDIIAAYPPDAPFPVYERTVWFGDSWDPASFGRTFDFSRPFFEQFGELQNVVPRASLGGMKSENCDYCNFAFECRNCYLAHCLYSAEGMLYCYWMLEGKDCMNCSFCFRCEQCFGCTDCNECYNCLESVLSSQCADSSFLYDCRACRDCFGCVGLRQKSFCLFNEQLSKDEYVSRISSFDLQDPETLAMIRERVHSLELAHPHRFSIQEKCENATGDHLVEMKDCENCFQAFRCRDCANIADSDGVSDALDCYHPGWAEVIYNGYSSAHLKYSAFFCQCNEGSGLLYCDNCQGCTDCFGCISLKRKSHCILNRQYAKEEYETLLPKVIAHMKETAEWGEYFPMSLSPFCYNEAIVQEYFPLTREEALARGLRWRDDVPSTTGKETRSWEDIPSRIQEVPETVTKEIFSCERCSKNFRISAQELVFCRSKGAGLDHRCPDCRHLQRIALRNPRKLWNRVCAKCNAEIQTTYSPDRPEIVYCEKCYLEAVY